MVRRNSMSKERIDDQLLQFKAHSLSVTITVQQQRLLVELRSALVDKPMQLGRGAATQSLRVEQPCGL